MYGYIRPDRGALRGLDYQRFQSAYCGLCEALRRQCGPLARFVVNYDFTFMAMVLSDGGEAEWRRCPAHPLRKRPCVCYNAAMSAAADDSVILAWWKLKDGVADHGFFRSLPSRLGLALLRRAYKKASARQAAFDANARSCLAELAELEKADCDCLDRAADCFARLLAFAAQDAPREEDRRIRREIFYHVGRCVYILDAADDLPEDIAKGCFNPLRHRFALTADGLSEEARETLRATINLSQRSAATALSLRREDVWQPILENILSVGLPEVTELVLAGKWKGRRRRERYPDILRQGEKRR